MFFRGCPTFIGYHNKLKNSWGPSVVLSDVTYAWIGSMQFYITEPELRITPQKTSNVRTFENGSRVKLYYLVFTNMKEQSTILSGKNHLRIGYM